MTFGHFDKGQMDAHGILTVGLVWPFVGSRHLATRVYNLPVISFLFIRLRILRAIAHFFRLIRPHLYIASFLLQVYVA